MKINRKTVAMVMIGIFLLVQAVPVMADVKVKLQLNAKAPQINQQLQVFCDLKNASQITNGKLRLNYSPHQLKLISVNRGEALNQALCEINDCLTGNKQEGEIVIAFAASEPLAEDGNIISIEFELTSEVQVKDKIEVMATAENLGGNAGEISAEIGNLSVEVQPEDAGTPTVTPHEEWEGTPTPANENTPISKTMKMEGNNSTDKTSAVKTGDPAPIFPLAAVFSISIITIACIVKYKIKT